MGEQNLNNKKERKILFVGGIPRSGTSMLQKMLSFNKVVYAGPEFGVTPNFYNMYDHMYKRVKAGKQSLVFNKEVLDDTVKQFYNSIFQLHLDEGIEVISEKTPKNTLFFDRMLENWNDFKYILIIRDPRAILASLRKVQGRALKENRDIRYGQRMYTDLLFLDRYWKVMNKCLQMRSENLKVVYYEDLVSSPETLLKEICSFISIDFEPKMLKTDQETFTNKVVQANNNKSWYNEEIFNQKLSTRNVDKWKIELSKSDLKLIEQFLSKRRYEFLNRYKINVTSAGLLLKLKRWDYLIWSYSRAIRKRVKKLFK
ncbi:MAG: sulfotransferase [Bacteroidia bacterium]